MRKSASDITQASSPQLATIGDLFHQHANFFKNKVKQLNPAALKNTYSL